MAQSVEHLTLISAQVTISGCGIELRFQLSGNQLEVRFPSPSAPPSPPKENSKAVLKLKPEKLTCSTQ